MIQFLILKDSSALVHNWSFDQGLTDVVGSVLMTVVSPARLLKTTFGKERTVLDLVRSYSSLPNGVYFGGEFSVTFWVKIDSHVGDYPRIFQFESNKNGWDGVAMTISNSIGVYITFNTDVKECFAKIADKNIKNGEWTFIAVTYKNFQVKYYFNETYVGGGKSACDPRSVSRSGNYVGGVVGSYLGQVFNFKIYNKEISETDRLIEYYSTFYPVQEIVYT